MGISLLGPLMVDGETSRLGHHDRVVLQALAMRPGDALTSDQLTDAIWSERPPASAPKNLQSCVVRLRKLLGSAAIERSRHGYRLTLPADEIDAVRFARLVARGHELLTLGESERATYTLDQALGLWRGRPLVDLLDWEPGRIEAGRLEELRLEAQDVWLEAALDAGRHREVLAEARAMASAQPLRERRWQLLALAQYQAGRQSEALRTVAHVRRTMVQELGLDPGPDLEAFEQAILRQDPGLMTAALASSASDVSPYRGLMPYDVDDTESFFGRDAEVATCLERLGREGVLAVVGPSGSGKSSLVRAGIAAALRRVGRHVVVMTPGQHPLEALPAELRNREPPVLVVDQAEEIFSLCEDPAERTAFLDTMCDLVGRTPLVLALRADRMGELSAHARFARVVERGLFLLAAMSAEDLRTVVEGPARQAGLVVEPGLIDLLVREVEGEPGALPMLSHALRETWLRREGRALTVDGYQASGGIRGAVAQSAEAVYQTLEPSRRPVLRDLLLRLVSPSDDGDPVRLRMPHRLVVADASQAELLDVLVGSRLVTSDDAVVELAHEAVARAWPRLRGWLEDDLDGQRILHHVSAAADAWESLGRPESELYRGLRLTRAMEWQQGPHPELTALEAEFLGASRALAEREERAAVERAARQAELIRQLESSLAGAKALSTENIDEAVAAAIAGVRMSDSPVSRRNLVATLGKHPQLIRSIRYDGAGIDGLAVSPDGRTLASYDQAGRVQLLDLGTGQPLATFESGHDPLPCRSRAPITYHPEGSLLAVGPTARGSDAVVLLDADALRPGPVLPGLGETPSSLPQRAMGIAFSADGRRLAATIERWSAVPEGPGAEWASPTSHLLVWDLGETGPALRMHLDLPVPTKWWWWDRNAVAIAPDGIQVAVTQPLTMLDVESGDRVHETSLAGYALDSSPDGRAWAVDDGAVIVLVDQAAGTVRRRLHGHRADLEVLRFSPDGTRLASIDNDGVCIVWDVETGTECERMRLGETEISGLAWGLDNDTLYTAGDTGVIRIWDLDGARRYLSRQRPPGGFGVGWVCPAPNGRRAIHSLVDQVNLLDLHTGRSSTVAGLPGLRGGAWAPSGETFTGCLGRDLYVIDPRTAEPLRDNRERPLGWQTEDLCYTADGSHLVVCSNVGDIATVETASLAVVGRPISLRRTTSGISVDGAGRLALVLTGGEPTANDFALDRWEGLTGFALVDLATGQVRQHDEPGFSLWSGTLSPDGRRAAIGGRRGEILVVDTDTGQPVGPTVTAHAAPVNMLCWSSQSWLVSTGWDGSVALWDGWAGELLGTVVQPEKDICSAVFADEGRTVCIVTYRDGVYLWDTDLEHTLDFAYRMAVVSASEVAPPPATQG
jgi:DNA-binding SARP family transcriptional activator/WD40 repeat protein